MVTLSFIVSTSSCSCENKTKAKRINRYFAGQKEGQLGYIHLRFLATYLWNTASFVFIKIAIVSNPATGYLNHDLSAHTHQHADFTPLLSQDKALCSFTRTCSCESAQITLPNYKSDFTAAPFYLTTQSYVESD